MIYSIPGTQKRVIEQIEAAIGKADGMLGYFPRNQLYLAKGMVELAYKLLPEMSSELVALDCLICQKINDPKYFD